MGLFQVGNLNYPHHSTHLFAGRASTLYQTTPLNTIAWGKHNGTHSSLAKKSSTASRAPGQVGKP